MSFSSGTFSINSTGQPVVTGTVISSTAFNALTADLATGLSTCVLKDGTQTITANLPMASFKLTGLGSGSALTDSGTISQVQNNFGSYLTSVGGTNTITGTATPTPAYAVGQRFSFIPANTNTGATTLNISSVGAGAVQLAGAALTGGELVAAVPVTVCVTATTPVFEILATTQFQDSRALVVGATDSTKKIRFEADGITTGTTRVLTAQDRDLTIGPLLGTAVASTSGTAITFTGIPSYVRRITINFSGVSTNGTQDWFIQLGTSGGFETSGYLSSSNSGGTQVNGTTGLIINNFGSAAVVMNGSISLSVLNVATFLWSSFGVLGRSDGVGTCHSGGSKPLADTLTQVRVRADGVDTFDAGIINIIYE